MFVTVALDLTVLVMFGLKGAHMFVLGTHNTSVSWSFHTAIGGAAFVFLGALFNLLEASHAEEAIRNIHHRLTVWNTPYNLFVDQDNV
jgi:hypothetical protein